MTIQGVPIVRGDSLGEDFIDQARRFQMWHFQCEFRLVLFISETNECSVLIFKTVNNLVMKNVMNEFGLKKKYNVR